MLRKLNRGLGEKTQPKELRTTDYPQSNLYTSLVYSPVDATISNGTVIAYRLPQPARIDSILTGTLIQGTYGRGLTSLTGRVEARQLTPIALIPIRHRWISVFGTVISFTSNTFISSIGYTDWAMTVTPSYLGSLYPRGGDVAYTKLEKRGFRQALINFSGTNNYTPIDKTIIAYDQTILLGVDPSFSYTGGVYANRRFIFDGSQPHVSLTYTNANLNKLQGAAWLATQRTQYQTKFDPLKLIGA